MNHRRIERRESNEGKSEVWAIENKDKSLEHVRTTIIHRTA